MLKLLSGKLRQKQRLVMIKVKLQRCFANSTVTLGALSVGNSDHSPIYTLENPTRTADSAIPAGVYVCKPYSGTKYKNVWEVQAVPGRSAILIHAGNTEADTLGCILLGLSLGKLGNTVAVLESKSAVEALRKLVSDQAFELTIVD